MVQKLPGIHLLPSNSHSAVVRANDTDVFLRLTALPEYRVQENRAVRGSGCLTQSRSLTCYTTLQLPQQLEAHPTTESYGEAAHTQTQMPTSLRGRLRLPAHAQEPVVGLHLPGGDAHRGEGGSARALPTCRAAGGERLIARRRGDVHPTAERQQLCMHAATDLAAPALSLCVTV